MIAVLRRDGPAFSLGAVACLIFAMWLSPGGEADWLWEIYDDWRPVAVGRVDSIERQGDAIEFQLYTIKRRACDFGSTAAYGIARQARDQLFIQRVDRLPTGTTHPIGEEIRAGRWRLWPTTGSSSVEMWIAYRCSGRQVLTKVAEVPL